MYKGLLAAAFFASICLPYSAQAGEVYNRVGYQEHRIYQGVTNGTLSFPEYAHLQSQEYRINQQRVNDLRSNGGYLTGYQYSQLNREQNRLSGQIYRTKHDIWHP